MKRRFRSLHLFLVIASISGCVTSQLHTNPSSTFRQARYVMGTVLTITLDDVSEDLAKLAFKESFQEVQRLDQLLSTYKPESEISLLSKPNIVTNKVSESTYDVLGKAQRLSDLTHGSFSVLATLNSVTWDQRITFRPNSTVSLSSKELKIDLGAIGKGYAVDRIVALLKARGVKNALVDFGHSSFFLLGRPRGKSTWPIGVYFEKQPPITIEVSNLALSASESKSILDPATGIPVSKTRSAWVIAPSATDADALSTALVVNPKLLHESGTK